MTALKAFDNRWISRPIPTVYKESFQVFAFLTVVGNKERIERNPFFRIDFQVEPLESYCFGAFHYLNRKNLMITAIPDSCNDHRICLRTDIQPFRAAYRKLRQESHMNTTNL